MNNEPAIQVDMFEVQLGASLLLQFQTVDGDTVRVLADGGRGLPVSDIHQKLTGAMQAFGDRELRIDLLIGTHYDADHLDGLVPVIQDTNIAITEAWLPPVANDVDPHAADEAIGDRHLLPHQLYSQDGQRILARYLDAKAQTCQLLRPDGVERAVEERRVMSAGEDELLRHREMFEQYRDEAMRELRFGADYEAFTHADENAFDPATRQDLLKHVDSLFGNRVEGRLIDRDRFAQRDLNELATGVLRAVRPHSMASNNLAGIRKSAASDAINAISLARITNSLRAREIPIRSLMIADGAPRRFVWRTGSKRFEGGRRLSGQAPTLMLLGPSEGLVRKHWDRLPVGVYTDVALSSLSVLKSITPSNQLSYVIRFSAENQGILLSGDAGCVDFKPSGRRPYYKELLEVLSPLHVVQVAHHAGNNAHFYRVLEAVQYPMTVAQSFLLVSHATNDPHRPSREFRDFVEDIRHEPEIVSVLFTTQPRAEKIRDFESLVHTSVGPSSEEGDARLEFRNGAWTVTKHAIAVAHVSARKYPGGTGQPDMALATDLPVEAPIKIVKPAEKGTAQTG